MGASLTAKRPKVKDKTALMPDPRLLLAWYDKHRRDLPWRAGRGLTPDPYGVWLSEIMLQQTTVATVGPYFNKFITRWPRLADLAAASQDDILRMWAGLGYYRRARFLHLCAQKLVSEHGGVFPRDETSLLALPGFGPYTAAAVAAIAFDQPANVVDGNVERVIARIFAVTEPLPKAKTKLRALAATLVPPRRCGDYAQALMDLGATICTPTSPKCGLCPWSKACVALTHGNAETLPRRVAKAARPVRRAVAFALTDNHGRLLLRRRGEQGLLANMMEVPSSPWGEHQMPSLDQALPYAPVKATWHLLPGFVTHVFTHFSLEIAVAVAKTGGRSVKIDGFWVAGDALGDEALPSVMKKIAAYALKSL